MNIIFYTVLQIITYAVMTTLAIDMIVWTFTDKEPGSASESVGKLVESVLNLPLKIVFGIFDVVVSVIETLLKLFFSILGLDSIADNIKLYKLSEGV